MAVILALTREVTLLGAQILVVIRAIVEAGVAARAIRDAVVADLADRPVEAAQVAIHLRVMEMARAQAVRGLGGALKTLATAMITATAARALRTMISPLTVPGSRRLRLGSPSLRHAKGGVHRGRQSGRLDGPQAGSRLFRFPAARCH